MFARAKKLFTCLFVVYACLATCKTIYGQTAPTADTPASFRQKLEQIGVGNAATVRRKDGVVFSGPISTLSNTSVVLADRQLNVSVDIPYDQIGDVIAGAAAKKPWSGKAKVSHSRRNLAIVLLAAGILVPVIIAVSRSRSSGPVFSPAP